MVETYRQRRERWQVAELLKQHGDLRVVPSADEDLVIRGRLPFEATGPAGEAIRDEYLVELRVPPGFPVELPTARELSQRIPKGYHKLVGDLLCLGAPTAVRLELTLSPTLPTFVNGFVIPYLYGYSFYERHGRPPYGELAHGNSGIRQHLVELFVAPGSPAPEEFLRLASLKKREANKRPCPCRSGRRFGKCHNRQVNPLRRQFGRRWFRREYLEVLATFGLELPDAREADLEGRVSTPAAYTAAATGIWRPLGERSSRYVKRSTN